MSEIESATSFLPFVQRQAASRNNRTHGAKGQHFARMFRDDHLFRCGLVPPLLMASRLTDEPESMSFQNGRDLGGGKTRRPSVTQP
jgi:hypothetical protein